MSNGGYDGVIAKDKVIAIITQDDPVLLVEEAERAGKQLAEQKLTKSQIRTIFGTVRQIQMNWAPSAGREEERAHVRQLLLLKPKLAYQAAREAKVKPLADVLDLAIGHVEGQRVRFQRFVELFEAILAYHTKYGGK
jgi:CRISPR-associated protein Csm2